MNALIYEILYKYPYYKMVQLKKVVLDDVYEAVHSYVEKSGKSVDTYEDMVEMILAMIKDGYCFAMDRDHLRDAMESLTYMYSPVDQMNKDRLVQQFVDEEETDSDDEMEEGVDMLKMMQMMGMPPPPRTAPSSVTKEESILPDGNAEDDTAENSAENSAENDSEKVD